MKAIFAALNTLAVALIFEIERLNALLAGPLDGAGTGISLFFGIVEINDTVPWAQVPEYIFAMKTIMMAIMAYNIIFIVIEYKKSRKRLAEQAESK
ncbi:MAG: hypothetical protein IJ410_07890 [Oscillospiraceae bacterium]|nr:hypothetical protein [Oscillospiraceae bacterium]